MMYRLQILCALLLNTVACQQHSGEILAHPTPPTTTAEWLHLLKPLSKEPLSALAIEGDTLMELYYFTTDNVAKHVLTPKPKIAQLKSWFISSVLVKDTVLYGESGNVLRNSGGSTILFTPTYGLLSADIVDDSCKWEGSLQLGMSKSDVINHYFDEKLDKRVFININTIYLPSGMNYNGVYFTFKQDTLIRIVEAEFPD